MLRLTKFFAVATMLLVTNASAKTVTYVETVTRADGSLVITRTTVILPDDFVVTREALERSLLRSNLR